MCTDLANRIVAFVVPSLIVVLAGSTGTHARQQPAEPDDTPPEATAPASESKSSSRQPSIPDDSTHTDRHKKTTPEQGSQPDALMSEESLTRFQQLLHRKPLHNPAFTGLVRHYAEQGRLRELVGEYEQKVEALPDEAGLQIVLARLYLRVGQAQDAADLIDKVGPLPKASARDESKLLVFKSEVYQRIGRIEAARSMLGEALGRAKTTSERMKLSEALADLHLRAKDRDEAAEVLTRLAAEFSDRYLHRKRIADALAHRDLHERAIEQYRAILDLVRDETAKRCEVLRQLGRSLERLERRQEAIDAYAEAINLLAGGHWLQRELHERVVNLYRASGRLEDLVQYCQQQIERSPEQTAMRGLLADVLAATGDVDAAKKALVEAVQLFPKDRSLSEKRVQFLERFDDAEGVAAEYERIIPQHPDDVELYIAYGQFLANNRQLAAARNQWKHVLNDEVTDASLANRLGALFEPCELFDDAVECYERAVKLSPERPESYTALSRLWLFRGEKEKAVEALRRMAKANPKDASVHAASCQAMMNLGLADEALGAITRACELDPQQVRYQMNRSDLLVRTGQVSAALAVRRSAVELIRNPRQQALAIDVLVSMHASADQLDALTAEEKARWEADAQDVVSLLMLARVADFRRNFAEARRWLDRLVEAKPAHEEARRQLARLYEAVGDIEAAVDAYRELIDLHPTRGRQYYQAIADLKLRYNDKAGAVDTFEKMVQASPGNATVLKSVAEQLVRLGEFEKAISHYEQSLQLQPERHEVRLAYAEALQEAGRLEDALAAFKTTALQRSDHDSAVEALGKLHEAAGQLGVLDDLLQELQTRVETNPEDTLIARTLGELLIREYEYDRAMALLDLVLRYHPREADLQLVRAELLRRLTRFDEALEAYRRVLRFPNIDRDFVLGEMGKACFEAGRLEQARRVWRQIRHKLYAGTLLQNNGLLEDAIDVLSEGIRLKPDDFGLHRNLIRALQASGKIDEALEAARHLLDLEPDNVFNIQQLARAYLERGDRATAAEIAGRLFSAGVAEKKGKRGSSSGMYGGFGGGPIWAMSLQSAWGGFQGLPARSNLDRAVRFFQENGLLAELEDTLTEQLAAQPDNAILRQIAATLFSEMFGEPEVALGLLKELETASFPLEYQQWLGQCSQRDFMRVRQYQLIGSKPGLRDHRLAELGQKSSEELNRDQTLELVVIRQSQGANDEAVELLQGVVKSEVQDVVALSVLVNILVRAERFAEAEPHTVALIELLAGQRERMQAEMIERVRRDFVRTLPLQFQLRVSEDLLRDIAHKWTLGQGMVGDFTGFVQTMGYFRARLTLATIHAKTDRMAQAREIWEGLTPSNPADADGWTMLAGVAQLHDQDDLAYKYYDKALQAAKLLVADPLLQRVYSSSLSAAWYGQEDAIDSSFNRIVEAFAGQDKLIKLYDFLRETDQVVKARRVAEQYELYDELKILYGRRLEQSREAFRRSSDDQLIRSVPYFTQVCKLAEIQDQTGNWPEAGKTYRRYLEDFPDELGLLITLGEVAEVQEEYGQAVQWEKKLLQAKQRLARKARGWALRAIPMTPAVPQVLRISGRDVWQWQQRWGKRGWWGYGSRQRPFERWPSWMRIAQLYLSLDNSIAAADAMERAIGVAGTDRKKVGEQILGLIEQRQLTAQMLPVLRSLAVHLPTEEKVQLAFAESLEDNDKENVAAEVYRRMLRRGVSDVGVLARLRGKLEKLAPTAVEEAIDTLASLEATVKADPENANNGLRLAKAYYYSLDVDGALERLLDLEKIAPHLEDLHDLIVEIYTIRGDSEKLVEALHAKIKRSSNENEKRKAQHRLVEELLSAGETEEALDELTELVDPKNPTSYQRVGMLLHYFGRHEEATRQFELAGRSQRGGGWGGDQSKIALARAMVLEGDLQAAAEKILEAIEAQSRQATQYGGLGGMYGSFGTGTNHFDPFVSLFVVHPALLDEIRRNLLQQYEAKPDDPQAAKHLMHLYRRVGRPDLAESILEKMTAKGVTDQTLVTQLIDGAIKRHEYEKAIALAKRWIAQQPKPKLPPGVPPQFAGMMTLMSPRNGMLCKLGDVYWKMGDPDRAFETYREIVDEQVDETKIAYASICALRGRIDDARELVDEALAAQQVKSPSLLQFRSLLAAVDNEPEKAFDLLAKATEIGAGQAGNPFAAAMGGPGDTTGILGMFARKTGQIDRFAEFVKKRIKKNPNQWKDHHLLARTYYETGRIEEAFEVLDAAAKVKSLRREVLQQRIGWQEGYAPAEELIRGYEKLIEVSEKKVKAPSSMLARFFGGRSGEPSKIDTQSLRDRLGNLLWQQGEQEIAEGVWTERMNLKEASSHVGMGHRYLEKRTYDRAERSFQTALELEPANAAAHRALAGLAYHRQDGEAALAHLREVFLRRYQSDGPPDRGRMPWESRQPRREEPRDELRTWATDLARDPDIAARLRGGDGADDAEMRLALATLTGDWAAAEGELRRRSEESPYDPVIWTLWAKMQEHKGDWSEAAEAWEQVRRLKRTSIPKHRDRLKLVLAGKHIKDAAAGVRKVQAPLPGMARIAGTPFPQMSYYQSYGASLDDEMTHLSALYVKLGQFDKAERLHLLKSGGSNIQSMLPTLSMLMWRQGAKGRALELMKLAVLMSQDTNLIPQYAGLLAEMDRGEAATQLLTRAYRCVKKQSYGGPFGMMMGGYGGGREDEFEDHRERASSSALYDILERAGTLDVVLARLNEQVAAEPDDARLGKLILSLQIRDRRWEEARASLTSWRQARPEDVAIATELLHVNLQLEDWNAALAVLDELREEVKESANQWRMHEAFIRLMQGDTGAAVAAIEPLLDETPARMSDVSPVQVQVVLAMARDYDRLSSYLEKLESLNALDEPGRGLLCRLYRTQRRWNAAARLALDRLWKQAQALEGSSDWYRVLITVTREADAAGQPIKLDGERPADHAFLTLVTDGPGAGKAAFRELVAEQPDEINARRGLVFAAGLDGDHALAAEANRELIHWLEPRRRRIWQPPAHSPLSESAEAFLKNLQVRQTDSSAALGMSMSFTSLLQEVMGLNRGDEQEGGLTYEKLWKSHQRLHCDLLLCSGRADKLVALLKSQAAHAEAQERRPAGMSGRRGSMYYSGLYSPQIIRNFGPRGGQQQDFARDWRRASLEAYQRYRLLDLLVDHIEQLGSRVPGKDWNSVSELYAALGRDGQAERWRRKAAEALLVQVRATDEPRFESDQNRYSWRWRMYGRSAEQDLQKLRSALLVTLNWAGETPEDDRPCRFTGLPDELWELALIDPDIEAQLLQLAGNVGPGWGDSQSLWQLICYHNSKEQYREIIDLFERVYESEELLQSQRLKDYIKACYEAKDYERIETLLSDAVKLSPTLENDILLTRLMLLRHQDRPAEADTLEKQLLDRCRVEPTNPHRLDPRLLPSPGATARVSWPDNWPGSRFGSRGPRFYGRSPWMSPDGLATIGSVAGALGLRYEPKLQGEDLTLQRIRKNYVSHGFYQDAVRIGDLELAQSSSGMSPQQRMGLLNWKAEWLRRAGRDEAAREVLKEVEAFWVEKARQDPADAEPHRKLALLYNCKPMGPDHAKAYNAFCQAKCIDPSMDPSGLDGAGHLYKLGRYDEAWREYRTALTRGQLSSSAVTHVYQAGVTAHKVGQTELALGLLRQAHWCDPYHKLAEETRELIHE